MIKPLRKAVLPVAGLGTRFLPATKAMPKEMLPVVDKPLIQYAVDEARAAGIEQFCMVTGRGKTALIDHFDIAFELEATLAERGKRDALRSAARRRPCPQVPSPPCASRCRSASATPSGAPAPSSAMTLSPSCSPTIWCSARTPCLQQLADVYQRNRRHASSRSSEVPHEQTNRYGILENRRGELATGLR